MKFLLLGADNNKQMAVIDYETKWPGTAWMMRVKAYNLYNRSVYPVQSVNKQNEERWVGKQKASRVVIGAVGAFCEIQCV